MENQKFEQQFLASLQDCLERPNEADSPVLVALGGRGTFYSIVHNEENKRRIAVLKKEIEKNASLLEIVFNHCEKNRTLRKEGKECRMPPALLRTNAIELLYTNRYLDLGDEFYDALDSLYNFLTASNDTLREWADHGEDSEKWLLSTIEANKSRFSRIAGYLQQ